MDADQAYIELEKAISKDLSLDDLHDVAEHGADAGYAGFTTYAETNDFYDAHEEAIWVLLEAMAEDLGEGPLAVVAGFNTADQITDISTFKNALTWFALEEIARGETEETDDDDNSADVGADADED